MQYAVRLFTPWVMASERTLSRNQGAEITRLPAVSEYLFVEDVTTQVHQPIVTNALTGPLEMSFTVTGEDAERWFHDYLGYTVELGNGARPGWRGVVWTFDGVVNGQRVRRSLGDTWNSVRTVYRAPKTLDEAQTQWVWDEASIQHYGKREYAITLNWEMTQENALAIAAHFLHDYSRPYVQRKGIELNRENYIRVTVVGFQVPANNKYAFPNVWGSEETVDLSQRITDCLVSMEPWMSLGNIEENTSQVYEWVSYGFEDEEGEVPVYSSRYGDKNRAWSYVQRLTTAASMTRPWVTSGWNELLSFSKLDREPTMFFYGPHGGGLRAAGDSDIDWTTQPGVYRDMTFGSLGSDVDEEWLERGFWKPENEPLESRFGGWLMETRDTLIKGFRLNLETEQIATIPIDTSADDAMSEFLQVILPAELGKIK